jgi:hypothetical protein
VSDLALLLLVVGFFVLAVLVVGVCARVVGPRSALEEEGER